MTHGAKHPRVPSTPLHDFIRSKADQLGSINQIAVVLDRRYDTHSWKNQLRLILRSSIVTVWCVDQIATAFNLHFGDIYDYETYETVQPQSRITADV